MVLENIGLFTRFYRCYKVGDPSEESSDDDLHAKVAMNYGGPSSSNSDLLSARTYLARPMVTPLLSRVTG